MGFIVRCPLTGGSCAKTITVEEKSFFLAETEKPEDDRNRRRIAITEALGDQYQLKSALDEKGINAFTCKICEMIQTCAYGIADITQRNPNVLLELGMMIALGKPAIILSKRGEEKELNLPSDLSAIEIIPFEDYTEIIPQFRKVLENLPPPVSMPTPIEDLQRIRPEFAEELRRMRADVVKEFKESVAEAKLDTISLGEEKKEIPPDLDQRLKELEEKLEDMRGLGFVADARTAFLRGSYFYNEGKYEEALASLDWCLKLAPDDSDTLTNRGAAYVELGRYDEALADFDRSLEIKPDDAMTLNNRGVAYVKLERYDEALADFDRSLEIKPDDAMALSNRGGTYMKLERYDEALADIDRSLEIKPDYPSALHNRGTVYVALERYDEALVDFSRSLELEPDGFDSFVNRGITYSKLGRYDEALADSIRALELETDDASTLYNLACLFSLRGQTDDALDYLEKTIALDKKYQEDAKTDEDFDNIRDDPRFKKLIEPD